jgi:ubiquinone/menaquinone biosynthesis C-methylase UbiE
MRGAWIFPDDTFTHPFTCFAIFTVRHPEIAAGETYRVLRPGDVVVVGSVNRVDWLASVALRIHLPCMSCSKASYETVF